jgi:CRISPR/Cas system-associated protein Cas10 (large subunit of type III CRISPR-Cas system)
MTRSLPIAQFKKKNEEESSPSNNECAVCLGEFQEGEWLKHLPNCCHVFHTACIDTWFQSHTNCPLCRSHVFNLSPCRDFSVSTHTLLDIPTREELSQEREANYLALRSQILQNLALGP